MIALRLPPRRHLAALACLLGVVEGAGAVNIQDDLTQPAASLNWIPLNGACLTAGNNTGSVPACVGLPYYSGDGNRLLGGATGTLPDTAGNGALRFTDNNNQNGAVISNFVFAADLGVSATFTTVTYLGDSGGSGKDGADGISFFLMDATPTGAAVNPPTSLGAFGGSLGYSCSNTNATADGLVGAYVGLGIDEYGNFLNGVTSSGTASATGDNTATGYGYVPNRIGIRGAGNVAWSWLNKYYPYYYPSSLSGPSWTAGTQQHNAVMNTCKTGTLWDYSNPDSPKNLSPLTASTSHSQTGATLLDYAAIPNAYSVLSGVKIANESATTRLQGTPITYNLQITADGLLSLQYRINNGNYQPVLTKQSITSSNGTLPATLRFGFAGSTGGARNIHEITCFQATPADQSDSSAGVNTQQAAQVRTGTQVYLAYFHPSNWWGQLTSQNLVYTPSTGVVSISSTPNWDASCVLTGGTCASTGATGMSAEGSTSRAILSYNGSSGVALQFANLSNTEQTALDSSAPASGPSTRLNFLRGDRSNEITTSGSGLYRTRTSVLGDIWHSNPTWVGPPAGPYGATWTDILNPTASQPENAVGAQNYLSFASTYVARTNMVFAGANDGMMHGFRTGHYDGQISSGNPYGNYVANTSYPNDGQELIAYMPAATVQTIHNATTPTADYSSAQYGHAFSVDATPGTGDLFYQGLWHTWLVGGLGGGGSSIFALDITDPTQFSEANAGSLVIQEFNASNLPCATSGCASNLGNTYGTPVIRRFHNGMWGVVFGNGFGSSSGHAGVYVVTVDPGTAAMTAYYLDAGADPSGAARPSGIAFATPVDLDGDHVVDYIYAGDLLGNVWRFDLTSSSPSAWAVTNYGGSAGHPLFTAPSSTTATQPITTRPLVMSIPAATGPARVLVVFGTGQEFPSTTAGATTYAGGQQAVYGIWDWNMAGWNTLNPAVPFASLSGASAPATGALTYSSTASPAILASQTITQISATTASTPGTRTISTNGVCWAGSTTCASGSNNQYGWVANLPTTNEQVIYSPTVYQGAIIVNTTIPANNSNYACSTNLPSGWTMAFSPSNGGAFSNSFFPNATNAFVQVPSPGNPSVLVSVMGVQVNGTGTPLVVSAANNPYVVSQTTSGVGNVTRFNPPKNTQTKRLNWTQLR